MSVVVAILQDGVAYLGADTASSNGFVHCTVKGDSAKISRVGDTLVGAAGLAVGKQLLMAHPELLDFGDEGLSRRWIVTRFLPRFRALCEEMGLLDEDCVLPVDLVLAHKDRVYAIVGSRLFRVEHYCAIGSGSSYAMAALGDDSLPVEERLLASLRLAEAFDVAVDKPYLLLNNRDFAYKEVSQ